MSQTTVRLRPYKPSDEDETVALWQRSWQAAYPQIDFSQRLDWFRDHWRGLQDDSKIIVAEFAQPPARLAGFVAVAPRTGYLDQIVVAPEAQRMKVGQLLMEAAKLIGREGLYLHVNQDNERALAFYRRSGFDVAGEDVNRRSGAPVYMMTWRPVQPTLEP
jgi:putative acetyltransferase